MPASLRRIAGVVQNDVVDALVSSMYESIYDIVLNHIGDAPLRKLTNQGVREGEMIRL